MSLLWLPAGPQPSPGQEPRAPLAGPISPSWLFAGLQWVGALPAFIPQVPSGFAEGPRFSEGSWGPGSSEAQVGD